MLLNPVNLFKVKIKVEPFVVVVVSLHPLTRLVTLRSILVSLLRTT